MTTESDSRTDRSARRAVSMMDVAAHAGVSQKTVSRVVNGEPHVRPEVRERVQCAIDALEFRPNAAARSLVTRRTRRIGVVALGTSFHGPTSALAALESVARAGHYSLSVHRTDSTSRTEIQAAVDTLLSEGVEGIVLSEPMHLDGAPLRIRGDVAVLTLGARGLTSRPDELVVGTDEEDGGRVAAEHLVTLGHETVHHLAGPEGWISSQLRREGWESVLRHRGLRVPEPATGDWSPRSGYEAMQRLLDSDDPPTAVFVANDQMAVGAIAAIQAAGLHVPEDVSIVGFDDIDVAEFLATPLTTLRQQFTLAAHDGMNQLIRAIDGGVRTSPAHLVPITFVERATTAPPRPSQAPDHR
ncbi:LacI family DNA-binding transcriptional regulator [Brachybacterium kimchii]|uniref:LacI family DNA-binding transcriptional regulator n=1 Tax=Brachybacterium kimchii TaxID=2942909 RepID=A0ABY4N3V8_9MICO|nr:LacI family DNA-binding transcriptional regulator [Brachybacterium kimchii]UQN29250.1 LacI family DNA-binding transcriptional regulator [Brachybacterium kimchii]